MRQTRTIIFFCSVLALGIFPVEGMARPISLEPISTYPAEPSPDRFDKGAAETAAFDAESYSLLITNGAARTVDIIDIIDPANPVLQAAIDVTPYGDAPTDVAVSNGLAAVAVPNEETTEDGVVLGTDERGRA
jgi:hypothetical protein